MIRVRFRLHCAGYGASNTAVTSEPSGEPGYTVDVVYPSAFGAFQAPVHLAYVAALGGRRSPAIDRPFTYADLGCGAGLTVCVLADCYPHATFHGVDINPAHIAAARDLAARAGLENVQFHEMDFAALDTLRLPQLDFIALSGIYSWLAPATRAAVLGQSERLLGPDGLVFLHYGALPGNNQIDQLYALIREIAANADGDSVQRFGHAVAVVKRMAAAEALFFRANPYARAWIDSLERQDERSMAHEVLNAQRASLSVRDAAREAAAHGLGFVANAQVEFNHLALVAPPQLRADLDGLERIGREMLMDAVRNAHSRMDVLARPGDTEGFAPAAGAMILDRLSTGPLSAERAKLARASGVAFEAPVHSAILAVVDSHAVTFAALAAAPRLAAYPAAEVTAAVQHLVATKLLHVLCRPYSLARSRGALASKLNRLLLDERIESAGPLPLASQVAGTQLLLPPADRLALLSIVGGDFDAAWRRIEAAGQRINQDGKPVRSAAALANVAESRAARVGGTMIPALSRMGILV